MADPKSLTVEQALSQPVEEMLPVAGAQGGIASETNMNGKTNGTGGKHKYASEGLEQGAHCKSSDMAAEETKELLAELKRTREQRDGFQGQYKGLLAKLTQMRSTLGDRLRQDAEELDRREGQIETLSSQIKSLKEAVNTLKAELVSSNGENERVTKELDSLRTSSQAALEAAGRAAQEAAAKIISRNEGEQERNLRETQLHQLTKKVETFKAQLSEWESLYRDEKTRREEAESMLERANLDHKSLSVELRRAQDLAQREKDAARGLQAVLEEFQADQEAELQRALGDYQRKYDAVVADLEDHKDRSRRTEKRYVEYQEAAERAKTLEQEVREKNLLIGKLRHEAVILNEHLTEALRRLNRDTTDTNVDRRLVTNVLLQFLTTPRQDAKRFEMLNLLSTILQWTDDEKSTAGIQRVSSGVETPRRFVGIGATTPRTSSTSRISASGQESFSNLFVEFLLSEASQAQPSDVSGPRSPSRKPSNSPQTAPAGKTSFERSQSPLGPDSTTGKHFGSSRRSGNISNSTTSSKRESRSSNLRPSVQEEGPS